MNKIQNIQALRGVAVLLVVIFHLTLIEQKYGGTKTILPAFFEFGLFGVDLFFVISGFIMVAITRGKFQDTKQAFHFLYHRASRIYPAYWVYSILVLFVFMINPALVNSSQGNQVDILSSFLLLPAETLPLLMVGWTLIHEMYFYLVFFLVLLLVPEKTMPATILLWGLVVAFSNICFESTNPFTSLAYNPLTIEFIAGCLLALIFFHSSNRMMKTRSILILAFIGLLSAVYGHDYFQHITGQIEPHGWWRVLIFGIPAALTVFCFVNAERNGYAIHSSLVKIGDASYSIYLTHILTLSLTGRIWGMFSSNTIYDNLIMIPVLFVLVIVVGTLGYRFIEKPLLGISRRIA